MQMGVEGSSTQGRAQTGSSTHRHRPVVAVAIGEGSTKALAWAAERGTYEGSRSPALRMPGDIPG